MKTDKKLVEKILFAAVLIITAAGLLIPAAEVYADDVYNVVPRMIWSLSENQSGMHAFTFGDGVYEFRFDSIDITQMDYLEFDIYLPDSEVISRWETGETEFEITSSGTCDTEEYAWSGNSLWVEAARNGLELRDGWNHVKLNLPKSSPANLSRINYIRWYWNTDGDDRKTEGCRVANLKFTVRGGIDPANVHLEPFIPAARFETEDVPVALADVTLPPYNADPSGISDATGAIQDALNDVSLNGGGTVWMPAGIYRITGQIRIPAYVTLRGDWTDPDTSAEYGTVIALDIPENDLRNTGTFLLGGCGGVYGLTIYYLNQSIDDIKAYPFTFYVEGHNGNSYLMPSVINCTVLNGYRGIGATTQLFGDLFENGHENMYVMNYRGTFLSCGAEAYTETDFGFWDDVKISTKYWTEAAHAGILPPVDESKLVQFTKEHTEGLILGDLDWVSLNNVIVENCYIGIHTVQGLRDDTNFQGMMYGINAKNCSRGIVVDALHPDIGLLLANSNIDGGIFNTTHTVVKMFNVKVNGPREGRLREDSDFSLDLPIPDTDFGYAKPKAILYTADLDMSGKTDVSAKLQTLLNKAGVTGGVVYLPGGIYRLDSPVNIPTGVELKGTSAVPTRDLAYGDLYNGTTLLSYYIGSGPDDRALITLNGKGAGLSGIRINYPENRIHGSLFERDLGSTSYAVKGMASDVYIVNSYIIASAYGVDFSGCGRHYIKGLASYCYRNALKLGGVGGVVCNSFQNPGMTFISSTPNVVLPIGNSHDLYGYYTRDNSDYVVLENASGELIYNIAMFGPHNMLANVVSNDTTVINLSSDYMKGVQMIMNGGSMTVVNAMRWDGTSFQHDKGTLKLYNRFEHGFSSGLNGDAIEETYVAEK